MKKKCTKFESLFVFSDEETLLEHIKICPDCKKEQEKMDKISELIKEVKPYYKKKIPSSLLLKIACIATMSILTAFTIGVFHMNTNLLDVIVYGQTFSAEDLGFPTDEYGFITVN